MGEKRELLDAALEFGSWIGVMDTQLKILKKYHPNIEFHPNLIDSTKRKIRKYEEILRKFRNGGYREGKQ